MRRILLTVLAAVGLGAIASNAQANERSPFQLLGGSQPAAATHVDQPSATPVAYYRYYYNRPYNGYYRPYGTYYRGNYYRPYYNGYNNGYYRPWRGYGWGPGLPFGGRWGVF